MACVLDVPPRPIEACVVAGDFRADAASDAVRAGSSTDVVQLRAWLHDRRDDGRLVSVRGPAARRLGVLGDAGSAVPIAALLDDPLEMVRVSACAALQQIGTTETEQPLIAALDDPARTVRMGAAEALGLTGTSAAWSRLRERVDNDPDVWVRFRAAEALVTLGDPEAADYVKSARGRETVFQWGRRSGWTRIGKQLQSG